MTSVKYSSDAIDIKDVPELRNDYPVKIYFAGAWYPSVENAFQAAKTNDEDSRKVIASSLVKDAKRKGRSISIRPNWDKQERGNVMMALMTQKFLSQDGEECRQVLIDTNDRPLIVTGQKDPYWTEKLPFILELIREQIYIVEGMGRYCSELPNDIEKEIISLMEEGDYGLANLGLTESQIIKKLGLILSDSGTKNFSLVLQHLVSNDSIDVSENLDESLFYPIEL